jgi:hypothetical protein
MNYVKSVYSSASKAPKKIINKVRETIYPSPFLPNEMLAHIVEQAQEDPTTIAALSDSNKNILKEEVSYLENKKTSKEVEGFIRLFLACKPSLNTQSRISNFNSRYVFTQFLLLNALNRKKLLREIEGNATYKQAFQEYQEDLTPKQAKKLIHRNRKMPEALLKLCLKKIIMHEPYCTVMTLLDILGTTSNKKEAIKILAKPLGKATLKQWPALLSTAVIYASLYFAE